MPRDVSAKAATDLRSLDLKPLPKRIRDIRAIAGKYAQRQLLEIGLSDFPRIDELPPVHRNVLEPHAELIGIGVDRYAKLPQSIQQLTEIMGGVAIGFWEEQLLDDAARRGMAAKGSEVQDECEKSPRRRAQPAAADFDGGCA